MNIKTLVLVLLGWWLLSGARARPAEVGPLVLDPAVSADGGFNAIVAGEPGRAYAVEASEDLSNWTGLLRFLSFEAEERFEDPEAPLRSHRFYRVQDLTASVPAPPNDDFARRILLAGENQSVAVTNATATAEAGEPAHLSAASHSVWWSWTASSGRRVVLDTFGSDFDTVLAVYTGDALRNLVLVGENDDYGGQRTSRVSFVPVSGQSYQIAVDSYSPTLVGNRTQLQLRVGEPPAVEIGSPSDYEIIPGPSPVEVQVLASGESRIVRVLLDEHEGRFSVELNESPFVHTIDDASGRYHVFARAEDEEGRFTITPAGWFLRRSPG